MFRPDAILHPEHSQLPALGLFSVVPEGTQSAVGCFLPQHLKCWKAITANMWLLNTLSTGYKLQFHRRPPPNIVVRPTLIRNPKHLITLAAEIKSLLQKQAIEVVHGPDQLNVFFSRYFLIPKKDGGIQPILDLRDLNVFLKRLTFHMLRVADVIRAVNRNDWFITIDLRDGSYHIPIVAHHRRFLHFHVNGVTYQFRVLPFGLALAPRTFTKCVRVALEPLQRQGMRILPYLNYWLLCRHSQHQVQQQTRSLILHIQALGLKINYKKICLIPAQTVQIIGMRLDSCTMRATLTEARSQAIAKTVAKFQIGRLLAYADFLHLAGMLVAATPVVRLGMLRLRPLQRRLNSQRLSAMTQKHVLVTVTLACFHTLKHWSCKDHLLRGVPLGVLPVRREVVTTDASLQGWGAVWRHQKVRGLWHSTLQHIHVLEMRAVWLALQHFQRQLKDKHVVIRTDNTTVEFYINHQGGTRSQSLLNLAQRLWKWADVHLLSLRARYLPGRYNQIAGSLSRANPTPWDWQIHKEVIQAIWDTYGRAEVDLFEDKQTTHCPMWFSDKDEPGALGQDTLAHSWPKFH